MTPTQFKTYENRLRRAAERQGLRLAKSRTRDPHAAAWGTYTLVTPYAAAFADEPDGFGMYLSEVAQILFDEYPVHVDYAQYDGLTFDDTDGEPILAYQGGSSTRSGGPDGWVLYPGCDSHIIGGDLTNVDWAVAQAKRWLRDNRIAKRSE